MAEIILRNGYSVHERRLYFSNKCSTCSHRFQSFRKTKISSGKCRKCRVKTNTENQVPLFPIIPNVEKEIL